MAKILLVEDNELNRDMLSRRLQRKGHQVLLAADGMQAILMAESETPDLVLLDMSLPGIDGHEVLRRMRAQPGLAHLPCVAVSADAMPHQIALARSAGFDDYWVKPLDVPTLAERVLHYAPKQPPGCWPRLFLSAE